MEGGGEERLSRLPIESALVPWGWAQGPSSPRVWLPPRVSGPGAPMPWTSLMLMVLARPPQATSPPAAQLGPFASWA